LGGNLISLLFPSPFLVFPPVNGAVLSMGDFDDSPFPRFRSARCFASEAAAATAAASSAAARSSLAGIAFHLGFSTYQPIPVISNILTTSLRFLRTLLNSLSVLLGLTLDDLSLSDIWPLTRVHDRWTILLLLLSANLDRFLGVSIRLTIWKGIGNFGRRTQLTKLYPTGLFGFI